MATFGQDLYETRTNLFSCENLIEYFWRRCSKNTYPFKPENTSDIETKVLDNYFLYGKEIAEDYVLDSKEKKIADIKSKTQYNLDLCAFRTLNIQKVTITTGILALVYKPDRRNYLLFLVEREDDEKKLKLLMSVKQKPGLFGSFETEMINYY